MQFGLKTSAIITVLILIIGCNRYSPGNNSGSNNIDLRANTPREAAKKVIEYRTSPDYAITTFENAYMVENADEINKTLSIAEVDTIDKEMPLAAVYISYSVGNNIYRKVIATRKTGSDWIRTFGIWRIDNEDIDEWENNSASLWEGYN